MDTWQVLAEPRRRRLLQLCWDNERCVGQLHAAMPDVSLGAISQHLARLRAASLVHVRAEGRLRHYRADRQRLADLQVSLEAMWTAALDQLGALAADATTEDKP
jgi:DNA-binding transcriptional ArsR family regulator